MPNQQLYTTIIEKKAILYAIQAKYNLFGNAKNMNVKIIYKY